MSKNPRVVFFQRKPLPIHKSIESIFEDVRLRLQNKISAVKFEFSYYSKGILDRIRIMLQASRNQGDINHITGDIHFAAILLDKNKTLITIHDCGMLASSAGFKHRLLKHFWFTLPLKKCRYVTVVSESTKRELLKYVSYPSEKIYTIPVPVSTNFLYSSKFFNTANPVILQYCTTPNKNSIRVAEALRNIQCLLILVGRIDGELLNTLQRFDISYENHFDISDEALVALYNRADIVSFPSTYEGFGMPIVEAQAVGRPVITSNISSMPEVAGDAACLVDPYNVEDIRNGILKLIDDEPYRHELIKKGLNNCNRFNPDTIANAYLQLYHKILSTF